MGLTSLSIDPGLLLLRDFLHSDDVGRELSFDKKCTLVVEILDQIRILSENGFTVEPIKTTNVLITPKGSAQLFDFTLSQQQQQPPKFINESSQTQHQQAETVAIGHFLKLLVDDAEDARDRHTSSLLSLADKCINEPKYLNL